MDAGLLLDSIKWSNFADYAGTAVRHGNIIGPIASFTSDGPTP
jgi:hypothetical protein